ncbi:MAG: cytochrome P460 family protein [Rhizobacter sp.]|nr:cytochrome P460 family protein [Bacteriovorax sp.]
MKKKLLLLSLVCLSLFCYGETAPDLMNGYRLKDFSGFENKWKLVTVRFRKDTSEMRFTYANPLAYKTLLKGRVDYPDGAVFAKIGFKTEEDPSFISSVVPSGARRYQFMVRNKKKYKETSGWNYVLFDESGIVFPENIETQTQACAACHNAVPERGYVFSQMIDIHPRKKDKKESVNKLIKGSGFIFANFETSNLPKEISKNIPEQFKYIKVLEGEISQHIFQGTLEEIKPTLENEVENSKRPALLMSQDKTRYSLVVPENIGVACQDGQRLGIYMLSIHTAAPGSQGGPSEIKTHFCHSSH